MHPLQDLVAPDNSMVYSLSIPKNYKNYSVVHLEALDIVVASKVWAEAWANKKNQCILRQHGCS